MKRALPGLLLLFCAGPLAAQAPPPAASLQTDGLESDWEIAAVLQKIGDHASRILPLLSQADTAAWTSKGAPAAYAEQLQSSKEQARALVAETKAVAGEPRTLSGELKVLFREQSLEMTLGTVADGLRKYQSQETAQQLIAASAETGEDRDRLQHYIVNLAAQREKEFMMLDSEVQRCRATVMTPPKKKK